jgi:primosomal protein N' (replication factor Y)
MMHEAQFFARVIVPAPLRDPLVYSIPQNLSDQITVGRRVLVPLQRRTVTGVVWEVLAQNPIELARPIVAPLDDRPILDEQLLNLCRWISQYYLAPLGEVLSTMLPPNSRRESKRIVIPILRRRELMNSPEDS